MKLEKDRFLVQVKYSDLLDDPDALETYFLGYGGELYLTVEELRKRDPRISTRIASYRDHHTLPLRLHAPVVDIDYSDLKKTLPSLTLLYGEISLVCRELGADSVVTHAELGARQGVHSAEFRNAVSLWRELSGVLRKNALTASIENHCEETPDGLVALRDRVGNGALGLCVDVGHCHAFARIPVRQWLTALPAGSITEVHLADNRGESDSHLALGEGTVDYAAFFDLLDGRGERPVFVLEPRNLAEAKRSIIFLKDLGVME
jgi:sugar phosphate isomerase/epimerase